MPVRLSCAGPALGILTLSLLPEAVQAVHTLTIFPPRCFIRNSDLFNNNLSFASPLVSSTGTSPHASPRHTPSKFKKKPADLPLALSAPPLPEEVIHAISVPHPLPRPSFGRPFSLRFSASRTYMLGLGEFSTVYLAAWRANDVQEAQWALCAVKRVNPDRDSQKAAFNEAYILARLGSQRALTSQSAQQTNATRDCEHIVRILGVKDEHHQDVELLEPETPSVSDSFKAVKLQRRGSILSRRHAPRASLPGNFIPAPALESSDSPTSQDCPLLHVSKNQDSLPEDDSSSSIGYPEQSTPSTVHLELPSSPNALQHLSLQQAIGRGRPSTHQDASVRRAISLRDPSAHSGNKPSGSDEADAKKSTVSAQEAQANGTAPRLLLVYELCPGGTVASFIRRKGHEVGRSLWLRWAKQIVAALAHCHRFGILHGDVKTQNVMLTAELDSRLCDFGSSLAVSPSDPPTEGLGIGTVAYNAPELVAPSPHPFGLAADVFSAGIVLHTLITGREPYSTCRNTVEQMLHVSRGGYWSWASNQLWEQTHLTQPTHASHSRPGSLYSMASDEDSFISHSLRSPHAHQRQSSSYSAILGTSKRTLNRQDVDWLLNIPAASHSTEQEDDPSRSRRLSRVQTEEQLPVSSLASDDEAESPLPSPRLGSRPASPALRPSSESPHRRRASMLQSYSDGSPLQYFLDGQDPVPEGVIRLLEKMTSPRPENVSSLPCVLALLMAIRTDPFECRDQL